MEQFLNEKITEAKREIDRLTHVCQTKPLDSADFLKMSFKSNAWQHKSKCTN